MIGKTISHYKILEELGRGGMGVVYKAQDTKLKRTVALKFLPKDVSIDEVAKKRFLQEAQAAAALNHPNICTIHEINEIKGQSFIVMEYLEGQELKKKIDSEPLEIKEIVTIATQIAAGLNAAHEKQIVHRDIKSNNIMVTKSNQVKIMDFGLAKLAGVAQITKAETTLGTVNYMSPEQIQALETNYRTDLWSFGIILYEMLAGELPFQGEYEAAVIYNILNNEPKAIEQFRSDVPDTILTLLRQLLQKDPTNRPSSVGEIIEGLTQTQIPKTKIEEIKSIAVLYFENMSSDKENEYFCAGITEDLIIDLSKIQQLNVIPRSDVLPFRNKEINSRQVGETLKVRYILEGGVRKSGNKLRITAQLIDVKSGFQLWAERYDRLVEDIFDVQMEVSEHIAEALKVSLTESERESLAQRPTDDLRAYDFYMRGSEFLLRRGKKNNETAIQMFEHALSIDQNFTMAYVGLAEACTYNYIFYHGDRAWLEKIMEYNEKALELDSNLIEAQFGIGMVYAHQKRYNDALQCFAEVIKIKKDFYPAYLWSGIISWVLERYENAVKFHKKAVALKAYSEEPWHYLDITYRQMGDLKTADNLQDKLLELAEHRLEVDPESVTTMSRVAIAYANVGKRTEALKAVEKIIQTAPNDGMALYNCAATYAILSKKEEAFSYLEKALKMGFMNIIDWLPNDPYFKSVRNDPDYKKILEKYLT